MILPAASAFVLAGALGLLARALRRARGRIAAFELEAEALRDEVWELKEAAAARYRAEAASEAKSRFLATVSHEIRTPLAGVLGLARLLADSRLDAEQRSYVEAIATSGAALASLIDEILDFSKIEAGKFEIAEEAFELVPLVEGVVELLAPRAQGKGLEIAAAIAPETPSRLVGDPARMRQVLINLAGNAVKFTERGGVGVRVWTEGDRLLVSVADTGVGVAPENRDLIFEDFEQGDGSPARRHEGAGLGLAISRRIVERLGGALTLDATSAGGSDFRFWIPLRPADPDSGSDAADSPLRLGGRRALIVGASPFEAPFLAERLARAGASVSRALGENEGCEALAAAPAPDLVIVDCALGEDATKRLCSAARAAGVARSLVLFSPFERRALGGAIDGFDGWLVKPVRSRSLALRLSPQPQAGGPQAAVPERARPALGLRVLVAEDNPINALVAVKNLQAVGAEVTLVEDGRSALVAYEEALAGRRPAFHLLLMDLRMPELDGVSAAKAIRLAETRAGAPRLRIVALTANAFEEDRAACFDAGMDEILTKPIDFARIERLLAEVDHSSATARVMR